MFVSEMMKFVTFTATPVQIVGQSLVNREQCGNGDTSWDSTQSQRFCYSHPEGMLMMLYPR